jgi:hypothetical protein
MGNTLPTFYTGCNFTGIISTLSAGKYDLNQIGLPNDSIQSVKVPKGFKVTLYEHGGFQGGNYVLDGTNAGVELSSCGFAALVKFNTGTNVNKNTSSILVEQISGFENSSESKSNNGHRYWIYLLVLILFVVLFYNREKIMKNISK